MCSGVAVGEAGIAAGTLFARSNTVRPVAEEILQAKPARRGAAAAVDRRADAARRPCRELLVPAPSGRLRVDRGAGAGAAGRRHGLRGGLRLRSARRGGGGERGRRRRQPGGARARAAALPASEPALRARRGRTLRRALRRRHLPADDRARAGPGRRARALQVDAGRLPERRRLRLHPEPPDPGAARAPRSPTTPGTSRSTAPPSSASSARRTSAGSSCSASPTRASCGSTAGR